MDVATAVRGTRSMRVRLTSLALALMLAAGTLLLVQQRADATVSGSPAPAAVVGATDGVTAQIPDFSAIVCPILLQVRNAFADSPFFNFIEPIINQLLVSFGCAISG